MQAQNAHLEFFIRPAVINDLDRLTELHCASFQPDEHVPVMLGKDYVRATYRWAVNSGQAYCLVADLGHTVVGLVSVCDGSYTRPMFVACLPQFMRSLLCSPKLIFEQRLWGRLVRRPQTPRESQRIADHPGFAQLMIIAIDSDWRGTGVFRALIEAAETCSRSRGSLAIRAGVYKFNQRSRRAFIKSGWIEIAELETNDTVFYAYFMDSHLPNELGISLSSG